MNFHVFESDEALYAQSAAALVAGQVPYRDFFYPSPPVFLILEAFAVLVSQSILSIRLLSVGFGILNIYLTYCLALRVTGSPWRSRVAALVYAAIPFASYFDKIAIIDVPLTTFILAGFIVFLRTRERSALPDASDLQVVRGYLVAGLLIGLASLTKYSAILVAGVVLASLLLGRNRKGVLPFVLGAVALPIAWLHLALATGILDAFVTETIVWQLVRFPQIPFDKAWTFFHYLAWVYPLVVIIVGVMLAARFKRRSRILPWYLAFVGLTLLGRTAFVHYFIFMTPFLCTALAEILPEPASRRAAWRAVRQILRPGVPRDLPDAARVTAGVALVGILLVNYGFLAYLGYGAAWPGAFATFGTPSELPRIHEKNLVAAYIAQVTRANETIWTSDSAIAFLSEREIAPANVSYWRFQGFFPDVWGYELGGRYRGPIPGYPDGLVTLSQIREGWEAYRPAAIVIVRASLVDQLVWGGISNVDTNQSGLGSWITARYHLGPTIDGVGSTFSPGNIEVWVRD